MLTNETTFELEQLLYIFFKDGNSILTTRISDEAVSLIRNPITLNTTGNILHIYNRDSILDDYGFKVATCPISGYNINIENIVSLKCFLNIAALSILEIQQSHDLSTVPNLKRKVDLFINSMRLIPIQHRINIIKNDTIYKNELDSSIRANKEQVIGILLKRDKIPNDLTYPALQPIINQQLIQQNNNLPRIPTDDLNRTKKLLEVLMQDNTDTVSCTISMEKLLTPSSSNNYKYG